MAISRHGPLPKLSESMRTIVIVKDDLRSPERRGRGRTAAPEAESCEARRVVVMAGQMLAFNVQRSTLTFNIQQWTELYPKLRPIMFMGLLSPKRTITLTLNLNSQLNIPTFRLGLGLELKPTLRQFIAIVVGCFVVVVHPSLASSSLKSKESNVRFLLSVNPSTPPWSTIANPSFMRITSCDLVGQPMSQRLGILLDASGYSALRVTCRLKAASHVRLSAPAFWFCVVTGLEVVRFVRVLELDERDLVWARFALATWVM
ncbi:hypothetical protein K443DRAFT_120626 [Laccaria amethystina LaAM-08-1]|uniref:Uncharacterized protein n=1 Tax=Laccaria amethystina LaAM-08-1 TaxID=1095629 RepID=A0A0C9XUJ6_9AGAR|nr:hypothetical protein K443DRAFT_120626 [Laccaria amethystina LaAM-08-1]